MHLNSTDINATLIGNFGLVENSIIPDFQHTGTWYDYLTGESVEVNDVTAQITLIHKPYNSNSTKRLADNRATPINIALI